MARRVSEGRPEPLGVTLDAQGVNIAVFSAHATAIEFCLFDAQGDKEIERIALPARSGDIFHGHIADVPAGARYGLRAQGPYAPRAGHRFNPAKLLIDPYANAIDRPFKLHPSMLGFRDNNPYDDWARDETDSAPFMPKCIVTAPTKIATKRPKIGWAESIIYELHVRGFTKTKPDVPEALRGTFAGLAQPGALGHLKALGVTAVEIMPAMAWLDERHLPALGLTNYWGYNAIPFMAPDPRLAPGGWDEVAKTVEALHSAGIEVLLDVVINHSGESDEFGATVCYRGLDNASYYRLIPNDPARYINDMGCGNCLALDRPPLVRLSVDALRAWAERTGIDGLRFDLATALGRRDWGYEQNAPLFQAIADDPVLRDLKLIAEPWDIGPGGYQVGNFPPGWGQWSDRFRDDVRRFWRGDGWKRGDLATRVAGSSDVLPPQSQPSRNINFVTAHDGFTLADLVSYEHKHNEANGEQNRDGTGENWSWNNGAEGESNDPGIVDRRRRDQANLLATLLMARGTPMLSMGAEFGHSQGGNNNAYAQDNEKSWIDWSRIDGDLQSVATQLIALRKARPALRADRWLTGKPFDASGLPDIEWRGAPGPLMTGDDWNGDAGDTLVAVLSASDGDTVDRVAVIIHRAHAPAMIVMPHTRDHHRWHTAIDTAHPDAPPSPDSNDELVIEARSVVIVVEDRDSTGMWKPRLADTATLDRLSWTAGIAPEWWDEEGGRHIVSDDTKRALLTAMNLPAATMSQARESIALLELMNTPPSPNTEQCFMPESLRHGGRRFGVSAQLYALRRPGDQGIGDFTTLAKLAESTARNGGGIVGINPVHALFPNDRERASPYHPSDRRFLDPIYLDIAALDDLPGERATDAETAALAKGEIVDYRHVWALKRRILESRFAAFETASTASASSPLVEAFANFVVTGGQSLGRFSAHEAIAETLQGQTWPHWPAELRDPAGLAVAEFAAAHASRVRYHMFEQFLCDRQFAAAATRACDAGLTFGFYRDLAVGAAPDGAEAWSNAADLAHGVSVGAPPDRFSADGQIWNLPPPNPWASRRSEFRAFRELIAANMRHAGALRIDHVMELTRLFWIPDGAKGADGAYVSYPLDDLLRNLARESQAQNCMVIGEDLGTVPDGLREKLSAADIFSYRVLWFERDGVSFRSPSTYPAKAVACVTTHDLPTLAGWWLGGDIAERESLGQITTEAAIRMRILRREEKEVLSRALHDARLLPALPDLDRPMNEDFAVAAIAWVGEAPTHFVLAQADDLAGETIATNLPGTDRERPNWRRRLAPDLDHIFTGSLSQRVFERLRTIRGGS
ncbi:MAG TPA: glycogen debranching protein GlgX [Magnetospirillaceae bacterium]|jgi:glycogen operon protein